MRTLLLLLPLGAALAGCSASRESIRMRAIAPGIDDAWRKLHVAAEVDGFALEGVDPQSRSFVTAWRDLREEERAGAAGEPMQRVRLMVRLAPRGRMFDVILTVQLAPSAGEQIRPIPAPPDHPFTMKWRRLLGRMLERESREED